MRRMARANPSGLFRYDRYARPAPFGGIPLGVAVEEAAIGDSIRMPRAPMSASTMAANGSGPIPPNSTNRRPVRGAASSSASATLWSKSHAPTIHWLVRRAR